MKKKEFRPYSVYAAKTFFLEQLEKGYTMVAFSCGGGRPKDKHRTSRVCAFFHSDLKKTLSVEHREFDDGDHTIVLRPQVLEYCSEEMLYRHLKPLKIKLGERRSIKWVLEDMIGWEER